MPSTIVATAKAANANSYLTRVQFDAYLDDRLNAATLVAKSDDDKDRALIMGTRSIERIKWDPEMVGSRTTTTQALQFPASGVSNLYGDLFLDVDLIPQFVKDALAEAAIGHLLTDRTTDPSARGLERVKADVVEVEFNGESAVHEELADAVWDIVEPWALDSRDSPTALHQPELVRV